MRTVIAVLFESRLARFAASIFLALFIVVVDQWTKALVVESTLAESPMVLTSFFNLVYVENKGAAFGILAEAGTAGIFLLSAISAIISIFLAGYLWRGAPPPIESLAVSLILGGALGNLIDRVRQEYVVDFLDAHWGGYHWPAFNVADSAINVGAALLLLVLFAGFSKKH